jgi:membrane peptidoglycan carboxypeptidase
VAFVGYTPDYAASVMVMNPKARQDVGGFGGGLGAQIWHDAMLPILSKGAGTPFPPAGLPLQPLVPQAAGPR